jgi:hypothetical protein
MYLHGCISAYSSEGRPTRRCTGRRGCGASSPNVDWGAKHKAELRPQNAEVPVGQLIDLRSVELARSRCSKAYLGLLCEPAQVWKPKKTVTSFDSGLVFQTALAPPEMNERLERREDTTLSHRNALQNTILP